MSAPTNSEAKVVHWSSRLKCNGAKATSEAAGSDANKRWATRKPSAISAYIYADRMPEGLACVIRDTSSSGARLQLADKSSAVTVDDLPESFRIVVMRSREYTSVQCKVMRRHGDSLGIRYTSQFQTVAKPQRRLGSASAKR